MRVRASLAAAAVLAGVGATGAQAAPPAPSGPIKTYDGDPGRPGDPASWRTPEFLRDNGMLSIGAEYAYAAGFAGQGTSIGVVDSGTFAGHVREHGSLENNYTVGDRFIGVVAQGGTTGPTSGFYNQAFNDSHGTHVSGTIAASRDGVGQTTPAENMHGVAFNADLHMGNTAKTDGVLYGQLPANATAAQRLDNAYLGNVYRAVNASPTRDGKPIRIITSSWGSQPSTEDYSKMEPAPGDPPTFGLGPSWRYMTTPEGVPDADGNTSHWLNHAIDVARTGTIVQITAGNNGYPNPTTRGNAPYFLPDLERSFYTTAGVNPGLGRTLNADGSVKVPGTLSNFNRCGLVKWSCVTAPGNAINSTQVVLVNGVPTARYQSSSGTSMSGPHSAAILQLIMQRFPYMTNEQALHTMYTTGRQNATINATSRPQTITAGTPNPTAGELVAVPDPWNGWHTPNLKDAFNGPGQLLGPTAIDTKGFDDTWSNNISEVAIKARQGEDAAEAAAWAQTKADKGWGNGLPAGASPADRLAYETGTRREAARDARAYQGSLTKTGAGTLTLSGTNTWTGKTTVSGGTLRLTGSHAAPVEVTAGGTLAGDGTFGGDVTLAAGATLSVGAGGLKVGGTLALGGATLALDTSRPFTTGTGVFIQARSITGTFANLPNGATIEQGGQRLVVTYAPTGVLLFAPATLPVSGTVASTLSLTLGGAATFEPFVPGVEKDYTASTNATVTSTAGDATLTVSEPGRLTNGAFSLAEPLRVELGRSSWTGPASNETVPVTFKQLIKRTDPLRTGTYAKTLTFTLSTTAP
jgi:subtilase-type serine protease